MALIPLQQPTWEYDSTAKELVVTFFEQPPDSEPDPASWVPPRKAVMRLSVPAGTQIINLP